MILKDYQIDGVNFLRARSACGLSFEQGLGKTLTMLEYLRDGEKKPILIVCPLSVVGVWPSEIRKWGVSFRCAIASGDKIKRHMAMRSIIGKEADVLIINYDVLAKEKDKLKAIGFEVMILDESHKIKNSGAKVSLAAYEIGQTVKNRYILTGTPITSSPLDVWGQLYFLDPRILGNFWAFRNRYVIMKKMTVRCGSNKEREIEVPKGAKNLEELEERLKPFLMRKTKAECLDLPSKIYKEYPLTCSPEISRSYHEMKYTLGMILRGETDEVLKASSVADCINKMHQMCQGFVYNKDDQKKRIAKRFKDNPKAKALADIIDNLEGESCVILYHFQEDAEFLKDLLKSWPVFFLGDQSVEEKTALIDKFQAKEEQSIFLSQIDRASTGITLTKANHIIFYDNSWSHGVRAQVEDRIHRIGQTKTCIYHDLFLTNLIDEKILNVLKYKKDIADRVLGDSRRLADLILEGDL